ncbi:hypothetical protein B9Z19DRAFT_1121013 [Tuber borchii]|uniref:Uncharacterized protein n=1 Tax=Tuber borchii TaxID=42251 RepID=A0A2T7A3E7_TUBBO|nr:hypothetical protein B9Z19DRAFT_1121013 [Tuber borchii]
MGVIECHSDLTKVRTFGSSWYLMGMQRTINSDKMAMLKGRANQRQKKWLEDDEGMEKAKRKAQKARRRVIEAAWVPEDLADLETLASGLIK